MASIIHLLAFPLLLLLLAFSQPARTCDIHDKLALLKIKPAFSDHDAFFTWTAATDCCYWYGVTCSPTTVDRVTTLNLYNTAVSGFSGPLPDALGDLTALIFLVVGNHSRITGGLPSALTRLPSLSVLALPHNSLSGPIPLFLSQIRSLKVLDLSFNKFSGFVPPELAALPKLNNLHLDGNRLIGGIPPEFGEFGKSSTSPPSLHLSRNMLSGDIPAELGLPEWMTIDFSHNNLSGDANVLFGANKTIRYLNLSFNRFEFNLTTVKFPVNILEMVLNNNQITGSIPVQVNWLTSLVQFNVSNNRLCGIIPAGPVIDRFGDSDFSGNKCLCRSEEVCI